MTNVRNKWNLVPELEKVIKIYALEEEPHPNLYACTLIKNKSPFSLYKFNLKSTRKTTVILQER